MIFFAKSALGAALSLTFAACASAGTMNSSDHKAALETIGTNYKAAVAACASLTGNARDICRAEATGKERVARAELDERNEPNARHTLAVSSAKARSEYAIAKEKCDDKSGNDKATCLKDAKAAEARAMNEANDTRKTADAKRETGENARTSDAKRESPGDYIDDSAITAKVKAAVFEDSTLKSAEINVETYKGVVQLSGFVRSRGDINRAVEVTRKIKGVKSVSNSMVVKGQQ